MTVRLERRYRRLLALYPPDYRREYGEEMVGVLLAASGRRSYPEAGEALNVVLSAIRLRLFSITARWSGARWSDAMAVVGLLGSLLLLAKHLRPVAAELVWTLRFDTPFELALADGPRIGIWAAIAVAVLRGWRVTAAALAWGAVSGEIALAVLRPPTAGPGLLLSWPTLLALVPAAALSLAAGAPAGLAILGRARMLLVGSAGVAVVAGAAAVPLLATGTPPGGSDSFSVLAAISSTTMSMIALVTGAVVSALTLMAVLPLEPPVRRRVFALLAPILAVVTVINLGFDQAFASAVVVLPPAIPAALQWPLLATVPPVVFAVGVALVRHRERTAPR